MSRLGAVAACVALLLAAAGWSLVTSRWVADWLTSPHHRATIAECRFFFEVPAGRDPRSCYSTTSDGVLYIYGAGQGEVGDELSYVLTDDKVRPPDGRPIAFSPATVDWVFVAVALVASGSAVLGLITIAVRSRRRKPGDHAQYGGSPVALA
jgi:hypothetical protein